MDGSYDPAASTSRGGIGPGGRDGGIWIGLGSPVGPTVVRLGPRRGGRADRVRSGHLLRGRSINHGASEPPSSPLKEPLLRQRVFRRRGVALGKSCSAARKAASARLSVALLASPSHALSRYGPFSTDCWVDLPFGRSRGEGGSARGKHNRSRCGALRPTAAPAPAPPTPADSTNSARAHHLMRLPSRFRESWGLTRRREGWRVCRFIHHA